MSKVFLEIRTAKDGEQTPEAVSQLISSLTGMLRTSFLNSLLGQPPSLSLEIASLNQMVYFVVAVDASHEAFVRSQIAAQYPTSVITKMDDYLAPWSRFGFKAAGQLVQTAPFYFPFKTYNKFETTDPLAAILGVLGRTPPRTALVVQFLLTAAPRGWATAARNILKKGVSADPLKFEAHPQKALIEEKIAYPGFRVGFRILSVADNQETANNLLGQLAGTYGGYSLNEGNSFTLKRPYNQSDFISAVVRRTQRYTPKFQYLNTVEIASLYHFPGLSLTGLKNIAWGKTIKGEPPDNLPVDDHLTDDERKNLTIMARTEYKNTMTRFGIRLIDRRRHVYILGKSGTGKSVLLSNMAVADINNGYGISYIDPHGDAIDHILNYIPDNRINDVVLLDPSDTAHPFHLNPLEVKKPEQKELVASGIVAVFQKLFAYSWGPRLEYILRNTLMTLIEIPGATMLDIPRILTDKNYTAWAVSQLHPYYHSVLIEFWTREYAMYNDKLKSEAIAPILNKVGQFIGSPTIRMILRSPKSTINLEDLMNSGKIVLLNLSQGKIGEDNSTLLGALFITQFQLGAMNRAVVAEEQRKDFFLYVDEFQNFATTSFIKILSEARKYRLGLVLANQYTAQLPEEIQKAIFGNVGTIASFVVGADDANRIQNEFGNLYTQDDMVSLDKYQIITKISIDNRISNPFPAYTLPLPEHQTGNRQRVVEASLRQYNLSEEQSRQIAADAMAAIQAQAAASGAPPAPGLPGSGPSSAPPPPPAAISPAAAFGLIPKANPEDAKIGEKYQGTVKKVMQYGLFVEILPGLQGLVHLSKMNKDMAKSFPGTFKEGDKLEVKVLEIDDKKRVNLTTILEDKPQQQPKPKNDRPRLVPKEALPPFKTQSFKDALAKALDEKDTGKPAAAPLSPEPHQLLDQPDDLAVPPPHDLSVPDSEPKPQPSSIPVPTFDNPLPDVGERPSQKSVPVFSHDKQTPSAS